MVPLRRGIPIFVCPCGSMKFGKNTITLDPANLIRWSGSGVPAVLGEVGMDVVTGRLQQFVGGAARAVANLTDISSGGYTFDEFSDIASGTFVTSVVFPTFAAIPGASLPFTQVVAGDILVFVNGMSITSGGFVDASTLGVDLDASGTPSVVEGTTNQGLGDGRGANLGGVVRFPAVAIGAHTLTLHLSGGGASTGQVQRAANAPLRAICMHT